MSRINFCRLLVILSMAFIGWGQADARAPRVGQLPNGSVLGCASCHVNPSGGGALTPFGTDINNNYLVPSGRTGVVQWNAMLAMRDSDGDGVSNGQELGDPDGDNVVDANIQVTNPGDPNSFVPQQPAALAVTSFVIGGVTLQEDVKNPPVPSGMQRFEITMNQPVVTVSAGEFDIDRDFISYPTELIEAIATASDLAASADRMTLTGTVNLPEGATYQVLIGDEDIAPIADQQQYFFGTVELPDAVVYGTAMLPEGFRPGSDPGVAVLIDVEKFSSLLAGDDSTDLFEASIVRISNFIIAESDPEQLLFALPHVPDGSYALFLGQEVVDAQGNPLFDEDGFPLQLSAYLGLNIATGAVDAAKLVRVANGESVTGLEVMLQEETEPELTTITEASVLRVEANQFFVQHNGVEVRVAVISTPGDGSSTGTLLFGTDSESPDVDAIFDAFSQGMLPAVEFFPFSDLRQGDVVSILGLSVSEGTIQALMVLRHTTPAAVNADLDGDGDVDFSDFLSFAAAFGTSEGGPGYNAAADLDGDGMVAFSDFLIFANAFGKPVG